jgi:hypothetical protein
MLGRLFKTAANEYLRNRRRQTGNGPHRLPPTSVREAQHRAAGGVIRWLFRKFSRR